VAPRLSGVEQRAEGELAAVWQEHERVQGEWDAARAELAGWTASKPVSAQRAKQRRRVEPLAWSSVATRLRQGVPSHRKRRKVGPLAGLRATASVTVATRYRSLKSNAGVPVWSAQTWAAAGQGGRSGSSIGSARPQANVLGSASVARVPPRAAHGR
jgi:hypothetical protein